MLDFYKDKRVFITGHTGFKGSWLSQILIMAGAKVCGFSKEPNTKIRKSYEFNNWRYKRL